MRRFNPLFHGDMNATLNCVLNTAAHERENLLEVRLWRREGTVTRIQRAKHALDQMDYRGRYKPVNKK